MIAIPILTRIHVDRPPDVALRVWSREIMPKAHADQGEYWVREFLPLHFQRGNADRYGFQARSARYRVMKSKLAARGRAKEGGQVDLVLTGATRDAITRIVSIRGFPTRTTIAMQGPRYVTFRPFRPGGSTQPDKPAEITAVTNDEQHTLAQVLGDSAVERLDAFRAPKTLI